MGANGDVPDVSALQLHSDSVDPHRCAGTSWRWAGHGNGTGGSSMPSHALAQGDELSLSLACSTRAPSPPAAILLDISGSIGSGTRGGIGSGIGSGVDSEEWDTVLRSVALRAVVPVFASLPPPAAPAPAPAVHVDVGSGTGSNVGNGAIGGTGSRIDREAGAPAEVGTPTLQAAGPVFVSPVPPRASAPANVAPAHVGSGAGVSIGGGGCGIFSGRVAGALVLGPVQPMPGTRVA